jgi:hypothetical protein
MVGGGVPAGGFVDADFCAHAVLGLNVTASPNSLQRLDDGDDNDKADWTVDRAAPTWGALNVGQAPF